MNRAFKSARRGLPQVVGFCCFTRALCVFFDDGVPRVIHGWMDGWIDGWMDGWIYGFTDVNYV